MANKKPQDQEQGPGSPEPQEAQPPGASGEAAQGQQAGRGRSQESESGGKQESELDFESLREHGRALRTAAGEFRDATQQALADAESMARSGVRERPYAMLGAAFAAGWVLGGGVPVRLATFATSAVGRAALGLAAARLAELQTNGSGDPSERRREAPREEARGRDESGAHARM